MNPKYQIFISSTYEDLKDERDQVIKAILEMGHIPVGMEMFSAADEEQWKIIARQIDQSDYYVVVIAHRYGSVTDEGISYTEKEYDYAVSQGVPIYGFVIEESASRPANTIEKSKKAQESLKIFKKKVKSKPISFWNNAAELHGKVSIALSKAFNTNQRPGWVRATQAMNPETATELARLSSENAELRKKLDDSSTIFAPKFTLNFWIDWASWEDERQGKRVGGYRLYAELENIGNESAAVAKAFVYIPINILANHVLRDRHRLSSQPYEMQVDNANSNMRKNRSIGRLPFLPGTKECNVVLLAKDAVDNPNQYVLMYKVHPDRGYSQAGEIALKDVPIKSHRPTVEIDFS